MIREVLNHSQEARDAGHIEKDLRGVLEGVMAIAISVAAQMGHEFVDTSSEEFGVFIAFFADTPLRTVHRASVQTTLSTVRFTDLFFSLRSHEVCSSRCCDAVCRTCRWHNPKSFPPFQGAPHLRRAWEDFSHVRVIVFSMIGGVSKEVAEVVSIHYYEVDWTSTKVKGVGYFLARRVEQVVVGRTLSKL